MKKATMQQKREVAAIANRRDADIDLSDMPEVAEWSDAVMGRFFRPPKKPVTMRLDEDVIEWLKGYGPGHLTKANTLLRHAMVSTKSAKAAKKTRTA